VVFTFSVTVNATIQTPGWAITKGNGSAAITVTPETALTPGGIVPVTLKAANTADATKNDTFTAEVVLVSGFFERPAADTPSTVVRYGETSDGKGIVVLAAMEGIAPLSVAGGTETGYLVEDENLRAIFNAVYTPNAPNTTDKIESGSAAAAYTKDISAQILALFKVTITADGEDRVEIRGTDIPIGVDQWHPVVIDIGVPDTVNANLPVFSIPAGGLGTAAQNYRSIRLRVNRGAALIIEADNTGGEETPCTSGLMTGSTVEVMDGGSLRNGAYRGHALGKDSVIIARLGSRLATGPQPAAGADEEWVIGSGANAQVSWGVGDQNGSYIEIREGKIAFDTHLTVQKPLTLRHSVWFINGPTLTIAATLTAEESAYKFYGTYFQSGGVNPARPAAQVALKPAASISRSLLEPPAAKSPLINAAVTELLISNKGDNGKPAVVYEQPRSGYWNWGVP
jgi:hypothetical protein